MNLDFAALHPGEWGRFAGLEVRRDAVELLRSMGVTAIRLGGSFSDPAYYYWKNWRGRKWERASFGAFWERSYESSWGPFDFIDMCNAMGIVPIIKYSRYLGFTLAEMLKAGRLPRLVIEVGTSALECLY